MKQTPSASVDKQRKRRATRLASTSCAMCHTCKHVFQPAAAQAAFPTSTAAIAAGAGTAGAAPAAGLAAAGLAAAGAALLLSVQLLKVSAVYRRRCIVEGFLQVCHCLIWHLGHEPCTTTELQASGQ